MKLDRLTGHPHETQGHTASTPKEVTYKESGESGSEDGTLQIGGMLEKENQEHFFYLWVKFMGVGEQLEAKSAC